MSDDSDDIKMVTEEEEERGNRSTSRQQAITQRTYSRHKCKTKQNLFHEGPSTDEDEHKLQQRELEDAELLKEADIQLDGVGEEERAEILMVLRESKRESLGTEDYPEASTSALQALNTEMARGDKKKVIDQDKDVELLQEDPLPSNPAQVDQACSKQACDTTSSTKKELANQKTEMEVLASASSAHDNAQKVEKSKRAGRKLQTQEEVISASEDIAEQTPILELVLERVDKKRRLAKEIMIPRTTESDNVMRRSRTIRKKDEEAVSASDEVAEVKKSASFRRQIKGGGGRSSEDRSMPTGTGPSQTVVRTLHIEVRTSVEEEKESSVCSSNDESKKSGDRHHQKTPDSDVCSSHDERKRNSDRHMQKTAAQPHLITGSSSEKSDNSEVMEQDLISRVVKRVTEKQLDQMKLTTKQKEEGKLRFKDLFNRMSQSSSQPSSQPQLMSPLLELPEETAEVTQSSQDLFDFGGHPDEKAAPSTTNASVQGNNAQSLNLWPSESSNQELSGENSHSIIIEDSRSPSTFVRSEELRGQGSKDVDDMETQPQENMMLHGEEEELQFMARGQEDRQEEDDERARHVYNVQQVIQPGRSSPQSPEISSSQRLSQQERISPSKLSLVDEKDKRPLEHDNKFIWRPSPNPCLKRIYHCSRVASHHPYFCPQSRNIAKHTKIILEMFERYFIAVTQMQCSLDKLSWGGPVRTGNHMPDTLDARKRFGVQKSFNFDEENTEEDEDFENSKPVLRRRHTDNSVSGREKGAKAPATKERAFALFVERKGQVNAQPTSSDVDLSVAYNAETQIDSDDDLPDIDISSSTALPSVPLSQKDTNAENETPVSAVLVGGCSQSSDSLLDDQGNLYSTQLPYRKRKAENYDRNILAPSLAERPKRACSVQQQALSEDDSNHILEVQPLNRKRKQKSPVDIDDAVYLVGVDSDSGASSPRRRKIIVEAKQAGFVHIAVGAVRGNGKATNLVPPRPRNAGQRESNKKPQQHTQVSLTDSGDADNRPGGQVLEMMAMNPTNLREGIEDGDSQVTERQPSIPHEQQSAGEAEESDESVQFINPSFLSHKMKKKKNKEAREGQDDGSQPMETEDVEEDIIGRFSSSHSSQHQPEQEVVEHAEEAKMVACPLCNSMFTAETIQEHASDCQGPVDEEEQAQKHPQPSVSEKTTLYTPDQLKRRPLHTVSKGDENKCALCEAKFCDGAQLEQHFTSCLRQLQSEQDALASTSSRSVSTRAAASRINFRIPKRQTAESAADQIMVEQDDETENLNSGDSDRDSDFALTKDDREQEKEDQRDDFTTEHKKSQHDSSLEVFGPTKKQPKRRRRIKIRENK